MLRLCKGRPLNPIASKNRYVSYDNFIFSRATTRTTQQAQHQTTTQISSDGDTSPAKEQYAMPIMLQCPCSSCHKKALTAVEHHAGTNTSGHGKGPINRHAFGLVGHRKRARKAIQDIGSGPNVNVTMLMIARKIPSVINLLQAAEPFRPNILDGLGGRKAKTNIDVGGLFSEISMHKYLWRNCRRTLGREHTHWGRFQESSKGEGVLELVSLARPEKNCAKLRTMWGGEL